MKKILIIDNYDSFVHTIDYYLKCLGVETLMFKNDKVDLKALSHLNFDGILISPGPGHPRDSGCSKAVIKFYHDKLPLLGVCLGHQAIAEVFGGTVKNANSVMHGHTAMICHDADPLFKNIPNPFTATRYHSLVVQHLPACLKRIAWTSEGQTKVNMGIKHIQYPVYGVQYHPEAVLSEYGFEFFGNFINIL